MSGSFDLIFGTHGIWVLYNAALYHSNVDLTKADKTFFFFLNVLIRIRHESVLQSQAFFEGPQHVATCHVLILQHNIMIIIIKRSLCVRCSWYDVKGRLKRPAWLIEFGEVLWATQTFKHVVRPPSRRWFDADKSNRRDKTLEAIHRFSWKNGNQTIRWVFFVRFQNFKKVRRLSTSRSPPVMDLGEKEWKAAGAFL